MRNAKFKGLSHRQRQKKLLAALREKTGGVLSENELRELIRHIGPARQYAVFVYTDLDGLVSEMLRRSVERVRYIRNGRQIHICELKQRYSEEESAGAWLAAIANDAQTGAMVFLLLPEPKRERKRDRNEFQRQKEALCL